MGPQLALPSLIPYFDTHRGLPIAYQVKNPVVAVFRVFCGVTADSHGRTQMAGVTWQWPYYVDLDADEVREPAREKHACYCASLEMALEKLMRDHSPINERVLSIEEHVEPASGFPAHRCTSFVLVQTARWWWSLERRAGDTLWVIQRARDYNCVHGWSQGLPRGGASWWTWGRHRCPILITSQELVHGPQVSELLNSLLRAGTLESGPHQRDASRAFADSVLDICARSCHPTRSLC